MTIEEDMWDNDFGELVHMTALDAVENFIEACFVKTGFDEMLDQYRDDLVELWAIDEPTYPNWFGDLDPEARKKFSEDQEQYYHKVRVLDDLITNLRNDVDVQTAFAMSVVEEAFDMITNRKYIELMG